MYSCDTFAICGKLRPDGRNLLAKNSDRPLGECQPLVYFPAQSYAPGEQVKCTYISIPQVEKTYAMLGSMPYWIFGFEMGVNEWGLAIGNEAEWSRCDQEEQDGLLGMDLLRLALERAKTAREAIQVISDLMAQYGQRGNARNRNGSEYYENSFMLVDPKEVWVMETAGRSWVAKQIHDWKAISNCYSIGTDYDLTGGGLEELARQRRWLAPGEAFDFTKACSRRPTGAVSRMRRQCQLIEQAAKPMTSEAVKNVLRDHFDGEIMEPRFGALTGTFASICMHAANLRGSQTAASVLFSWDDTLGVVGRYAPGIPCCSVFLPVYLTGRSLPKAMEYAGGFFAEESLWWHVDRLAMAMNIDEERFAGAAKKALRGLEQDLEARALRVEAAAAELKKQGQHEQAADLLDKLTADAVDSLLVLVKSLYRDIVAEVKADGGMYGGRMEFLAEYTEMVEMPLL